MSDTIKAIVAAADEGKTTLINDLPPPNPELLAKLKDLQEISMIKSHDPSFERFFTED